MHHYWIELGECLFWAYENSLGLVFEEVSKHLFLYSIIMNLNDLLKNYLNWQFCHMKKQTYPV